MIRIISDTHFGHDNIIRYCGRPHDCFELMEYHLTSLSPEDTLIHVGDFGFRHHKNRSELRDIFDSIPCKKKILIRGNHDDSFVIKLPWSVVQQNMYCQTGFGRIFISHWPLSDEEMEKMDHEIFIHGHIHEQGKRYRTLGSKLIVNACVEHWDYKSFNLETVVAEFHARMDLYKKKGWTCDDKRRGT